MNKDPGSWGSRSPTPILSLEGNTSCEQGSGDLGQEFPPEPRIPRSPTPILPSEGNTNCEQGSRELGHILGYYMSGKRLVAIPWGAAGTVPQKPLVPTPETRHLACSIYYLLTFRYYILDTRSVGTTSWGQLALCPRAHGTCSKHWASS